jgi:hypothetical protein
VYDKGNFGVPGQIECKRKKNDGEGYWMEREERRCRMCYRVIINVCPIVVGVITRMRLVSPIGGAPGGSGNLSTGCPTLRGWRHTQNLCGFLTPTAMEQSFIMTLCEEGERECSTCGCNEREGEKGTGRIIERRRKGDTMEERDMEEEGKNGIRKEDRG